MAPGRLLVVTSTWPLRAGDRRTPFVRDLAQDLAGMGWEITVLAPHAAGAAQRETDGTIEIRRFRYMLPESWQVLAYGAGGLINLRRGLVKLLALPFVLAQTLAIRAELRRFRPDVVHAHWLLPQGFTAGLASMGTGVPVAVTVHGGDVFALRGAVYRPFKKFAVRRAAAISANGRLTADAALALGAEPGKLRIIRFAPAFSGAVPEEAVADWRARFAPDATLVLFVGRLIAEKGPDDFIRAIAGAARANICGVICGDGPMLPALRDLAGALGVVDRIFFEGWLPPDAIACRMRGADALLFPSKRSPDGWEEAQGIVLVEAMRARLPIFAAQSGGIPELVRDGSTGWLFPEGDVAAMSALIERRADGALANVTDVIDRAEKVGRTEITREGTAEAFHRLFADLRNSRQAADSRARATS
jgi:phosphatidylinositol alpha-1,6-mannosyltransferase